MDCHMTAYDTFYAGERREIHMNVISETGRAFNITGASWTLKNALDQEIDSGTAQIDGHELSAVVPLEQQGAYRLIFRCEVDMERIIGVRDLHVKAV